MNRFALLCAVALVCQKAVAQPISVIVDGKQVQFQGAQPIEDAGRVLVSLRGVLGTDRRGSGWAPSEKVVRIRYGGAYVQLPVNRTVASVNGKKIESMPRHR